MKTSPGEKVIGILNQRYQYDRPSKGFVFDNVKLSFTTIENFEGKDEPDKWLSDKEILKLWK